MKIVHVKWIDSESYHGWRPKKDFAEFCETDFSPCESVGLLARSTDKYVVLAQSVSQFEVSENIKIPKSAIVSMKIVAIVKLENSLE